MTAVPATLRLRREGALRSRAARGDAAAFAAVYERHHQALYRYCRSILRHEEDAQDALQSTMTRAFAALQTERRDFELRPWLFRIAHNEAISILRRRRATEELGDLAGEAGEIETRVAEREELRVLALDLADLPERQRAALVLRELNGLSHAEIGQVLDLTPAAVKQAIFEARTALFSCREGREMACHDVRRMLSDGDGRVLRGRGVRAHLRTCRDCRRFREDLEQRPRALRMLAPPLPTAGAAALLSQILGGGGTAAKLLACVAIAGGGTTLAVEIQKSPPPAPAQPAEADPTPGSRPASAPPTAPPVAVTASGPQRRVPAESGASSERARPRAAKQGQSRRGKKAKTVPVARGRRERGAATAPGRERAAAVGAPRQQKAQKPAKVAKPATPAKRATPPRPAEKRATPVKTPRPVKTTEARAAPGKAKKQAGEKSAASEAPARGREKRDD